MNLKLTAFEKGLIEEIAIFSGYSPSIIREVLEFVFIRQIEQYSTTKKASIPFIGELEITYTGEEEINNCREAKITTNLTVGALLKRIVGECEDGNNELIQNLLEQKIPSALSNIILED